MLRRPPLEMLQELPFGAWLETSFTSIKKGQPATQNGSFESVIYVEAIVGKTFPTPAIASWKRGKA
jgi:hypothetical protein